MNDLINHTDEMIATYSNEGKMLFVNRAWMENMLYTEEEVGSLYLSHIIAPGSMPHVEENLVKLRAGQSIHNTQCTLIAKDGRNIHVEGTLVPIVENGELNASQCFFRNINERKYAEESKAQYARTLEDMIFYFSHKIRRPVASCLGLINLINSEEHLSESQLQEYAGYLNVSIKELDEYIHEMTDFLQQKKTKISDTISV
jgi:PAS domain S-box-containing protein